MRGEKCIKSKIEYYEKTRKTSQDMCHEVSEHTIWITFEVNIWNVCVAAIRVFNICLGATNARIIVAHKPLQCTPPSRTRGIHSRFIMWVPSKSFMEKNTPHTHTQTRVLGSTKVIRTIVCIYYIIIRAVIVLNVAGCNRFFRTIRFRIYEYNIPTRTR